MSKLSLTLLASLTSALLLAGCGQVAPTIARPVATQAATVATVSIKPGDTPAAVEAMTGARSCYGTPRAATITAPLWSA
ncbi:hypothetical protein MSS93_15070 [Deinococcus radiodurans]|nr:hypothetical protein MSS93_15070 [Deinococcus radiodurans]